MACGLPVVVTGGGATDDFAGDAFAYRIPSVRKAVRDETRALYFESPVNPTLEIIDIPALRKLVDELSGAPVSFSLGVDLRLGQTTERYRERITALGEGTFDLEPRFALGRIGPLPKGYWSLYLDGGFRYRSMRHKRALDLGGAEAVPGDIHGVVGTSKQPVVTLFINACPVTAKIPSVLKFFIISFFVVPVSAEHCRPVWL